MPKQEKVITRNGHGLNVTDLHRQLLGWGRRNYRAYPWRETKDPYRILMAEMMLIRTRADQVEPVYREFVADYPSLDEATEASREEIHDRLDVLGLTWRADRVYELLRELDTEHGGSVPTDKGELLSLSGVSQYVAGAVRCFGWGIAEPLIDANTVRISGRLFGLEIKPHSRETKRFQRLIADLLDQEDPKVYNFALLDLGALVCTSRSPDCEECPILELCHFGKERRSVE